MNQRSQIILALLLTCAGATACAQSTGLTTLYTFTDSANGVGPTGTLAVDKNGVLYGGTLFGGTDNSGVAYSLTPPAAGGGTWTQAVLYNFPGNGTLRAGVNGPMFVDSKGVVYGGTTGDFGQYSKYINGTVYALKPPAAPGGSWKHVTVCSFTPFEGPLGMAMTKSDVVYGISESQVFSCAPAPGGAWTETTLYTLPPASTTNFGVGVAVSQNGTIYSTGNSTASTGGMVFSLKPPSAPGGPWTETNLYNFPAAANGIDPDGLAMSAGALYGTTILGGSDDSACSGGIQPGCGVVFELAPPPSASGAWTQTVLHAFTNTPDGAFPNGVLAGPGGVLYGTTYSGGTYNQGSIFSLTPPASPGDTWTYNVVYSFTGGSDGATPNNLTLDANGVLYGTTAGSTAAPYGTVFAFQP